MMENLLNLKIQVVTKEKELKEINDIEKDIHDKNLEKSLCLLTEKIIDPENSIGIGQSAEVFKHPEFEKSPCYKIIHTTSNIDLPLEKEAEIMLKILNENIGTETRVPLPIAVISSNKFFNQKTKKIEKKEGLVMEQIYGYTLKEILENPKLLPKTYDHNKFFSDLKIFIEKMNSFGIYHRDLHSGNIMIEEETGSPVVIDFGRSTCNYSGNDDPYKQEYFITNEQTGLGEIKTMSFSRDIDKLKENRLAMHDLTFNK